jgi:hypothetical protein
MTQNRRGVIGLGVGVALAAGSARANRPLAM